MSWIDSSGNLWLFGGVGFNSAGKQGLLNDLWEFSPAANTWTWVSGSSTIDAQGVYGTVGVAAAGSVPGARSGSTSWTDSNGNLWLFGGNGDDSKGSAGDLNDIWEFNPTTKAWTWVSGSITADAPGVYGTLGVPAATNVPGARAYSVSWIDSSGDLWLFGGTGFSSTFGYLNDLWEFDFTSKEWVWVSGSNTLSVQNGGQPGIYGTLGTAATTNTPGGRESAIGWTDSSGNFWLFGGVGYDSTGAAGYINDLWRLQP
jgi:N-acetylneuraminic acid mutarotase